MNSTDVKEVLKSHGVTTLYHANSVITSLSYLKLGGLYSRMQMELHHYSQTKQYSDDLDKRMKIYNDIFLDSCDIHYQAGDINFYGPIQFQFDLDVLDKAPENAIWITRMNPVKWQSNMSMGQKYFLTINDLDRYFCSTDFGQSITIHNFSEPLPFQYLKRVVIDDLPELSKKLFLPSYKAIFKACKDRNIEVRIRDNCKPECRCLKTYENMDARCLKNWILPVE